MEKSTKKTCVQLLDYIYSLIDETLKDEIYKKFNSEELIKLKGELMDLSERIVLLQSKEAIRQRNYRNRKSLGLTKAS